MVSNQKTGWFGGMRIAFLIFFICSVCRLQALADSEGASQEPQSTIRTETAIVNVTLTATDKKGKHIPGLTSADFQIFEDKVPQKIEYFSELGESSEIPLTIVFLIDTSPSVKNKLKFEKAAAAEFFREVLRPDKDLAAIIQFDSEVNLVHDFTQNPNDLLNALESLKIGTSTALYDAIYLAADVKLKNEIGRKVILVITDGEDWESKVRKEEAIEAAQKSNALIYGIGVRSEEYGSNFGVLREFAEETGGAFFSPRSSMEELRAAFRSIRNEIQGQYSMAYRSSNIRKDGTYRSIDVRCKANGVRIRARKGYYAPKRNSAD
jgi:VWFA-related protein